ncbi:unnamed protein product, partial [Owenia fusiformis]
LQIIQPVLALTVNLCVKLMRKFNMKQATRGILSAIVIIILLECCEGRFRSAEPAPQQSSQRKNFRDLIRCKIFRTYTHEPCKTVHDYGCFCSRVSEGSAYRVNMCCEAQQRCYQSIIRQYKKLPSKYRITCDYGRHTCTCRDKSWTPNYRLCICDKNSAKCIARDIASPYSKYNAFEHQCPEEPNETAKRLLAMGGTK